MKDFCWTVALEISLIFSLLLRLHGVNKPKRVSSAPLLLHLQRLDGPQRGEGPLGDGLQLVVVEREQVEIVQVLEGVHAQTRYLICIQQPAREET